MPTGSKANFGKRRQEVTAAIRGKIELTFIEKSERERTVASRDDQHKLHCESSQEEVGSCSPCADGNLDTAFDFGIGELAEEFAALSSRAPVSAPHHASTAPEFCIVNGVAAPAPETPIIAPTLASASSCSKGLLPLPLNHLSTLPPLNFANLAAATLKPSYRTSDSFFSLTPLANSLDNHGAYAFQSSSNSSLSPPSPLSPQSPNSVSSTSSRAAQTTNHASPLRRPRVVRRFQYWCRVMERRRRHPMCRYCYECYAHMCKELSQPIPGVHDRGMWHGHNMRERGVVTCPHLWSTVCSRCGATKQSAHTEDYCPLVRNKHYMRLYSSNRSF